MTKARKLADSSLTSPSYTGGLVGDNLEYTGTLTGGTGIVNLGSGQLVKDAAGKVGIGTASPATTLDVQGTGTTTVGRFRTGGTGSSTIVDFGRIDSAVNAAVALNGTTGAIRFGTTTAHDLTLMTGSADRITLAADGVLSTANGIFRATIDGSGTFFAEGTQHIFRKGPSGSYVEFGRFEPTGQLVVGDGSSSRYVKIRGYSDGYLRFGYDSNGATAFYSSPSNTGNTDGGYMWFGGAGTKYMTLGSNGNLAVGGPPQPTVRTSIFGVDNTGITYSLICYDSGGNAALVVRNDRRVALGLNEAVIVDTVGRVQIGTPNSMYAATLSLKSAGNSYNLTSSRVGAGNGTLGHMVFETDNGAVGTIQTNGITTLYNQASDYRVKTNVRKADAARFNDINFVDFEWIDGKHDCGVIAHELAEIYPSLVTGEKDAVYEDGSIKYQQVSYTGLISRMGAVVQRHEKTIEHLMSEINSLKERLQ